MSDLGELARQSLIAVEAWTQNINANLIGANKIAYKNTRISFGAGIGEVLRPPSQTLMPIQFTQPSMSVLQTSVEFQAGSIVTSTQETHFAIKDRTGSPGTNFFVVQDPNDATKYFLTRDGEFHFATVKVQLRNPANSTAATQTITGDFLVNSYGLVVVGSGNKGFFDSTNAADTGGNKGNVNGADVKLAYGTASLADQGTANNSTTQIAPAQFGTIISRDATTTDPFLDNTAGVTTDFQRATGLTYVNTTQPPPVGSQPGFTLHNNPAVVNIKNPQNLTFSAYGSTIFDFAVRGPQAQPGSFDANGNDTFDFDATGTGARPMNWTVTTVVAGQGKGPPGSPDTYPSSWIGTGPYADMQDHALEQSNSSITTLIPELTLAQKMFTAVSKLITVYGNNIDTLNNLIR